MSHGTMILKVSLGSSASSSEPISEPTSDAGSNRMNQGASEPISRRYVHAPVMEPGSRAMVLVMLA